MTIKNKPTKQEIEKLYIKEKRSLKECARILKMNDGTFRNYALKYKIKLRKTYEVLIKDLTGFKFENLTVIKMVRPPKTRPKNYHTRWKAVCDCGKILVVRATSLIQGATGSCGCTKGRGHYTGVGDVSGHHLNRIKRGAIKRGLKFKITALEVWNLFLKQNQKCALSGQEINLVRCFKRRNKKRKVQTASLDRIDSSKGYTIDNVQWVHKHVNKCKQTFTNKEFILICSLVANYKGKKCLSSKNSKRKI